MVAYIIARRWRLIERANVHTIQGTDHRFKGHRTAKRISTQNEVTSGDTAHTRQPHQPSCPPLIKKPWPACCMNPKLIAKAPTTDFQQFRAGWPHCPEVQRHLRHSIRRPPNRRATFSSARSLERRKGQRCNWPHVIYKPNAASPNTFEWSVATDCLCCHFAQVARRGTAAAVSLTLGPTVETQGKRGKCSDANGYTLADKR